MDASRTGQMPAAEPLTFAGTVGLFTRARGPIRPLAVLFANPFGLEDMCTRKFRRIVAERLAAGGIASLRFDYPGCGDALEDAADLDCWVDAFVAAAARLSALSGCARIAVVAQGVGAIVAAQALEKIDGIDAVAFLAPTVSGRAYVRELSLLSQMVRAQLNLPQEEAPVEGLSVAGLVMPKTCADALKRVDLMKLTHPPAPRSIVFSRAANPADAAFAAHLSGLGGQVAQQAFNGYEKLTTNPTLAVIPADVVERLTEWIEALHPGREGLTVPAPLPLTTHEGEGFAETPLRFGEDDRLYGIVCGPLTGAPRKPWALLLLSSGYDPLPGWGRSSVELARRMARAGVVSLRFDGANVADSPPAWGFDGQVLYDARQLADVEAAVGLLAERAPGAAILAAGRCSGAYLALQAARADSRIAGVVAVNPYAFEWPKGRSVDAALAAPVQTMAHYSRKLWRKKTPTRVLRGDMFGKGRRVLGAMWRSATAPLRRTVGGIGCRERAVHAGLRLLCDRQVPVRLLYSAGDIGLEEFNLFFGRDHAGLTRYPNVAISVVENCDHNFTPRHAFERYAQTIADTGAMIAKARTGR